MTTTTNRSTARPSLLVRACVPALVAAGLAGNALADTEHYGCGLNPEGSLVVVQGDAILGRTLVLGIDNPLGTQSAGSIGAVYLSAAPDAAFPCGTTAFGFSMFGPGSPGEALVDLDPNRLIGLYFAGPWSGPGQTANASIALPNVPAFAGYDLFAQGVLIDPTGLGQTVIGATEGLRLRLEPAASVFEPVFEYGAIEIRRASAESRAFDYEYDDGVQDVDDDTSPLTTTTLDAQIDHSDYYGVPIGTAAATHVSHLGARVLSAAMTTSAQVEGNLFSEDAGGSANLRLEFTLTSRSRFAVDASATTTAGYSQSFVHLGRDGQTLFTMGAYNGSTDSNGASGWLEAGTHRLEAYATAQSFAPAVPDTATLDLTIRLFHLADFDLDGDVDQDDLANYDFEYADGSPDADVDGDDDTDADDRALFDAAWSAATGT
ncbi:hypothetical protein Pla163_21930 [Planctomycetes bacterium Pla163]|uniref:Uncharacterized protein n=1 Tax=Rohdeia mirabilis TaxID=2528008 RepID=A0A518D0P1_9BACT|nr:hypothetical protein Pla163_21930 [Planctomycetes bacterium Pla163]